MSDQTDEQFMLRRRDFLRTLASGAMLLAGGNMLAGCGGGGGSVGGRTTTVTGTVNMSQIGGSGLAIQTAIEANAPVSAQGTFSTQTSASASHLIFVTDGASKVRAVGIANPLTAQTMPLDATSTALVLVMITPGILTFDPTQTNQRIQQVSGLASFAPLVAYLAQSLPTKSLNDLQSDSTLDQLKTACINDWFTQFGSRVVLPTHGRATGDPAFTAALTTPPTVVVNLTNNGWRFLSIVREDLAAAPEATSDPTTLAMQEHPLRQRPLSFHTGLLVGIFGLFDGVTTVDLGSILTHIFTSEQPAQGQDPGAPADFTDIPNIASVRYWIYGPGNPLLNDSMATALLNGPSAAVQGSFNKTAAIGTSIIYYILWPAIDWALAEGDVLVKTESAPQIKLAIDTIWQVINGAGVNVAQLADAFDKGSTADQMAAVIGIVSAVVSASDAIVQALVKNGTIKIGAGLAANQILAAALSFLGPLFSAANVIHALLFWAADYPTVAYIELPVSSSGVTVQ